MTLEEARASIGRRVAYRPCPNCSDLDEPGVIVRVNGHFAFVRFASPTPQACLPRDLTLAEADAEVAR